MPGSSDGREESLRGAGGSHAADLELVRSVLRGDPRARAEFSGRMDFVGRLLVVVNGRHGRPLSDDELGDLAQDTLLVVWRKLAEYEGRATLESWIYRFTCLEFLNALRKHARRPQPLEGLSEAAASGAGREAPDPLVGEALAADEPPPLSRFLGHLGQREAEVVRLRHLEMLSFREIAAGLGISPSSAKTHYYRGLTKLRALLVAPSTEEEVR